TVYRLATAHPSKAVAGSLHFRISGEEQWLIEREAFQRPLFPRRGSKIEQIRPRYRRQGCYLSQSCDEAYFIPWNKYFDLNSVVYQGAAGIATSFERLPNKSNRAGRLETTLAPYQRDN